MFWLYKLLIPRPMMLTDVVNSIYGMKNSPDLPDYTGGAQNTSSSSMQAALVNQYLNRPNEQTPYGTRTWAQSGMIDIPGINGQPGFSIPQMTSSMNFSPEGRQLFDQQLALQKGLGDAGNSSLQQVQGALKNPVDLSTAPKVYGEADLQQNRDAVQNAMYERAMRQLQPQFDLEKRNTDTDLINRGFSVGNEGYTKEMDNVARRQGAQRQDALDSSILAGGAEQSRLANLSLSDRQQAISEMLMQRQLPMSELSALMGGSAPQPLSFQPFSASANSQGANFLGADATQGAQELSRYGLESERSNMIHKGIMDIWKQAAGTSGMGG